MKVKNCYGCGGCVAVCPTGAITLPVEEIEIDIDRCVKCGRCELMCPVGAIEIDRGDVYE